MTRPIFSASQVSTFELCKRKWAFDKIDGVPRESSAAALLGTAVHAQLEAWLRDGTVPDDTEAGQIAKSALHLLPAPKTPGMVLEGEFHIEMGGYLFRGFKDVEILSVPIVLDHKTTADFKWSKTSTDLIDDVQGALYAADAMFRSGSQRCELQWTYMRTRGARKAKPVNVVVSRENITPRLEKTVESAAAMTKILASGCAAKDVQYNDKACDNYGGCPYISRCERRPAERFEASMSQPSVNSLLTSLRARQNGINPPAPPPAPAPSPEPAIQPEASAVPTTTPETVTDRAGQTFTLPVAGSNDATETALFGAPLRELKTEIVFSEPAPKKRGRPARTEAPAEEVPVAFVSLLNQSATLLENLAKWTRTLAELARTDG